MFTCLQVGLNLAGGSSLLPYTNRTRQILVAAFKKSVNNDGHVQLLSIEVPSSFMCCISGHESYKFAVYLAVSINVYQRHVVCV